MDYQVSDVLYPNYMSQDKDIIPFVVSFIHLQYLWMAPLENYFDPFTKWTATKRFPIVY